MRNLFGFGNNRQRRDQQDIDMLLNHDGSGLPVLEFRDQVILATIIESFDYLFDHMRIEVSRPSLAKAIINSYRRGTDIVDLYNEALAESKQKYGEEIDGFIQDPEALRKLLAVVQETTRNHLQSV